VLKVNGFMNWNYFFFFFFNLNLIKYPFILSILLVIKYNFNIFLLYSKFKLYKIIIKNRNIYNIFEILFL